MTIVFDKSISLIDLVVGDFATTKVTIYKSLISGLFQWHSHTCPGPVITVHEAWYWPKRVLRSG